MSDVQVNLQHEFPVDADQVWAVLREFGSIDWALPGIKVDVAGSGPGMVRTLHMPGVDPVDEVLEALDDESRSFSYVIPGNMPVPVADFRANVRVDAMSADRCRIHWNATGTALAGADGQEIAGMLAKGYQGLFAALETRCLENNGTV